MKSGRTPVEVEGGGVGALLYDYVIYLETGQKRDRFRPKSFTNVTILNFFNFFVKKMNCAGIFPYAVHLLF